MFNLFIRSGPASFKSTGLFTDYRSAVFQGQDVAGAGNFYVDTGTRAPSREEQLLEEVVPRNHKQTKKNKILNEL